MENGSAFTRMVLAAVVLAGMAWPAETWQATSLRSDHLQVFAEKGDTLLGGSATGGILASADGGRTWQGVPSCFGGSFHSVIDLHVSGRLIVAAFDGAGICRSLDGGVTWEEANAGLPAQPFIHDVIRIGDTLVAGARRTSGGPAVYRAPASGGPWIPSAAGMDSGVKAVARFARDDRGVLYAGAAESRGPSAAYLYLSRDAGRTWEPASGRLPAPVHDLVWTEGRLIAATARGVFRTSDVGGAWEDCGPDFSAGETYALAARGPVVYAGSGNVVFRSRDAGGSWLALHDGLPGPDASIDALWAGPGSVLAGVGPSHGVWMLETSLGAHRPPRGAAVFRAARRKGPAADALGRIAAPGPGSRVRAFRSR